MVDDEFDFDPNDLSDEERREIEDKLDEEERLLREHPLNGQAQEIMHMIDVLLDTCGDEQMRETYGATMRDSAMIICAKLASGLLADSYSLAMQKASIIREHAEYLRLSNHMLNTVEAFDKNYVKAFRAEMEKFRALFREWADSIRKLDGDFEDDWNLFVK